MEEKEFGKFESCSELLRAYTELEKAYTKKCQKLAELLKEEELQKNEHSVENAQNEADFAQNCCKNEDFCTTETENMKNEESGTIDTKDALCDSTNFDCCGSIETAGAEENEALCYNNDADKRPIYMSPMFGLVAKEFFDSSAIASAFEREILELVATDQNLAFDDNALLHAAEQVIGKSVMQPVFGDKFLEALCAMPQIKQKVVDSYLKQLRKKDIPPVLIKTRTGAASGARKFGSIAEAGKHLLSSL